MKREAYQDRKTNSLQKEVAPTHRGLIDQIVLRLWTDDNLIQDRRTGKRILPQVTITR